MCQLQPLAEQTIAHRMPVLCGNKRSFQKVIFTQEAVLKQEIKQTEKRARKIFSISEAQIDHFESATLSDVEIYNHCENEHAWDDFSALPPISPIRLELTKENLELYEAFVSQTFTKSDHVKLLKLMEMHVQSYIAQLSSGFCPSAESLQISTSTHIQSSSQDITRKVNSKSDYAFPGGAIECGIDENQNEFVVRPYSYDPVHDPLLPHCPPVV
jgi:hypothetical protein